MSMAPRPLGHLAAGLLGFCAGFADTAGFLGLDGLFTAHVTGNLVVLGAQLARAQTEGAVLRVVALPVFAAIVAVCAWSADRRAKAGGAHPSGFLVAEGALLAAAAIAGWCLRAALAARDAGAIAVVGLVTIAAMAVQNAAMRLVYPGPVTTTVMTGNVTQLAMDATRLLGARFGRHAPEGVAEARGRMRKVGVATLGFVVGAAAGAALTGAVGLASLGLPAAVAFLLAWRERRPRDPQGAGT